MKKILTFLMAIWLCIGLCACGDESGGGFGVGAAKGPGQDAVETFLQAYYTGNVQMISSCVPLEVKAYMEQKTINARYLGVQSVELEVIRNRQLDSYEIEDIKEEYLRRAGANLDIQEAHEYQWAVIMQVPGELDTDDSHRYKMLAVKIRGNWYAIPD